jgi:hypothetical protein
MSGEGVVVVLDTSGEGEGESVVVVVGSEGEEVGSANV